MTLARMAKRRDANEASIVDALRMFGAVVYRIDTPVDLLVGHKGKWIAMEVKRPGQIKRLGKAQAEVVALRARGRVGQVCVVSSAQEAVGLLADRPRTEVRIEATIPAEVPKRARRRERHA